MLHLKYMKLIRPSVAGKKKFVLAVYNLINGLKDPGQITFENSMSLKRIN